MKNVVSMLFAKVARRAIIIILFTIDLMSRGATMNRPVHIINVEIKDNHEDAALGARYILQLAQMV